MELWQGRSLSSSESAQSPVPAQRLTNAFTALYRRPLQESEVNSWKGSLGAARFTPKAERNCDSQTTNCSTQPAYRSLFSNPLGHNRGGYEQVGCTCSATSPKC